MAKIWILFLFSLFFIQSAKASYLPISGKAVLSDQNVQIKAKKNGLVVVFLSAICPCSDSHVNELKQLHKEFKDFEFVAIHSNSDEEKKVVQSYFKKANLPFSVLKDTKAKIADQFQALKTPHAYIVLKDGSLVYQGGVSDSSEFERSSRKYLREALQDLSDGKKLKMSHTRTLGCVISRGGSHDW